MGPLPVLYAAWSHTVPQIHLLCSHLLGPHLSPLPWTLAGKSRGRKLPERTWNSILCKCTRWHCTEKGLQGDRGDDQEASSQGDRRRWSLEAGSGPPGGGVDRMYHIHSCFSRATSAPHLSNAAAVMGHSGTPHSHGSHPFALSHSAQIQKRLGHALACHNNKLPGSGQLWASTVAVAVAVTFPLVICSADIAAHTRDKLICFTSTV